MDGWMDWKSNQLLLVSHPTPPKIARKFVNFWGYYADKQTDKGQNITSLAEMLMLNDNVFSRTNIYPRYQYCNSRTTRVGQNNE